MVEIDQILTAMEWKLLIVMKYIAMASQKLSYAVHIYLVEQHQFCC